jgi:hypothetical protein
MGNEIAGIASATNLNGPQASYNSALAAQAQAVDENAKAREVRATEESGDSANAKPETQSKGATSEGTTKTTIEDKNVVLFRRYDDEGNMTNEVPPGYKGKA